MTRRWIFLGQLDLPLLLSVRFGLGDAQAERDIFKDVQVREEGVLLEHRVDRPLVGGHIIDFGTVKKHLSGSGFQKPADEAQGRRFAAAAGTQQCQKFFVVDVEIDVIQDDVVVKLDKAVGQTDQLLSHVSSPISVEIEAYPSGEWVRPFVSRQLYLFLWEMSI